MSSLDSLNTLLSDAGTLLDQASSEIRDTKLNPEQNIGRIGAALMKIFEVRMEIYQQRPDLSPEYLKK